MGNNEKILVGIVAAPQGLRGELRVRTFTEHPGDFGKFAVFHVIPAMDQSGGRRPEIHFVRAAGPNVAICKADGIDTRGGAEKLRGAELFISRSELPDLPVGEHYIADLIGMKIGGHAVADVHNFGAGDILELESGDMVSFKGAKVDYKKREITFVS